MTEKAIISALSCMNDGSGLVYLGLISSGRGYWKISLKAYEKALKIFEKLGDVHGKGIKLLNREARPHYPNALNWLALCYHKLGSQKKREAKEDRKDPVELVKTSSIFFSQAS